MPMRNDCHAETLEAGQSVQAHCQAIDQVMCQKAPEEFECTALARV